MTRAIEWAFKSVVKPREKRMFLYGFLPEIRMDNSSSEKAATIPNAVVKRIMTDGGAGRISPDAAAELGRALVEHGKKLTAAALTSAQHAGRTTVKQDDVVLAVQGR
jgi:histone H3/H4